MLFDVFHVQSLGAVDVSKVAHRARESPYPLITVDEAVDIVLEESTLLGKEEVYYKGTGILCLCI